MGTREGPSLVCFICGETKALPGILSHHKACTSKREQLQNRLPEGLRTTIGTEPACSLPTDVDRPEVFERYNSEARKEYESSLSPCPNCEIAFNSDELLSHMKTCCPTLLPDQRKQQRFSKMVVCYICGRESSYASLAIHQKECPKKREAEQMELPEKLRTPVGPPPTTAIPTNSDPMTVYKKFNEEAMESYQSSMSRCPKCSRTFFPDRLLVHMRGCCPDELDTTTEPLSPSYNTGRLSVGSQRFSRMLVCYICGRESSYASLAIHQKECPKKREAEQMELPEKLRTPVGPPPTTAIPTKSDPMTVYKKFNEEAMESYQSSMSRCPKCSRTFFPDRLLVHMRGCCWDELAELEAEQVTPRKGTTVSRMLVCHVCGREFGCTSLAIHLKQCPKKRDGEQALLPPKLRSPMPKPPNNPRPNEDSDLDTFVVYNEEARKNYEDSMPRCPKCSRTFYSDRLIVHMKGCCPLELQEDVTPFYEKPKPRTLVCYLCGREYSYASLPIHHKPENCPKKREIEQSTLPKHFRSPPPDPPTRPVPGENSPFPEFEAYNEEAMTQFCSSMAKCSRCSRSFFPDRLLVHLRSCNPSALEEKKSYDIVRMEKPRPTTFLVCYICGREFGYASLAIHQKDCPTKREAEQRDLLPHLRTAMGQPPSIPAPTKGDDPAIFQQYNEEAMDIYTKTMPRCPKCSRTFISDRLLVHMRGCCPQMLDPDSSKTAFSPRYNTGEGTPTTPRFSRMLVCYICGRESSYASLAIHQKECPKKREAEQMELPEKLRTPVGPPPTTAIPTKSDPMTVYKKFNEEAMESYQSSMSRCPKCSRTFFPDRLLVHMRGCCPSELGQSANDANDRVRSRSSKRNSNMGKSLVCYLCGRECSYVSFQRHQKECIKKIRGALTSVPKHVRPRIPDPPTTSIPAAESSSVEYEAFNSEAKRIQRESLPQCPKCDRKLAVDRIVSHIRSCCPKELFTSPSPVTPRRTQKNSTESRGRESQSPGSAEKRRRSRSLTSDHKRLSDALAKEREKQKTASQTERRASTIGPQLKTVAATSALPTPPSLQELRNAKKKKKDADERRQQFARRRSKSLTSIVVEHFGNADDASTDEEFAAAERSLCLSEDTSTDEEFLEAERKMLEATKDISPVPEGSPHENESDGDDTDEEFRRAEQAMLEDSLSRSEIVEDGPSTVSNGAEGATDGATDASLSVGQGEVSEDATAKMLSPSVVADQSSVSELVSPVLATSPTVVDDKKAEGASPLDVSNMSNDLASPDTKAPDADADADTNADTDAGVAHNRARLPSLEIPNALSEIEILELQFSQIFLSKKLELFNEGKIDAVRVSENDAFDLARSSQLTHEDWASMIEAVLTKGVNGYRKERDQLKVTHQPSMPEELMSPSLGEDLVFDQRHFYQEFMKIKLQMFESTGGYIANIGVDELYDQAVEGSVKPKDWFSFIQEALRPIEKQNKRQSTSISAGNKSGKSATKGTARRISFASDVGPESSPDKSTVSIDPNDSLEAAGISIPQTSSLEDGEHQRQESEFYAIFMTTKLSMFSQGIDVRNMTMEDVLEEANALSVPSSQWRTFIRSQLSEA